MSNEEEEEIELKDLEAEEFEEGLPSLGVYLKTRGFRLSLFVSSDPKSSFIEFCGWRAEDVVHWEISLLDILAVRQADDKDKPSSCFKISRGRPKKKHSMDLNPLNYQMCIFYIRKRTKHRWRLKNTKVDFSSLEDCRKWTSELTLHISKLDRPKKLLIFVNPFGGKKKARQIFEKHVSPLFDLTGVEGEVVLTERVNHARDAVMEHPTLEQDFDGVVSVGGDGLYNEILCGLVAREQRREGLDWNQLDSPLARPSMPVGLIPGGSANSLCATIHGTDDPLTAAVHIVRGLIRGVDACGVYVNMRLERFASTLCSYGWGGEVLEESETMRRCGPIRYKLAGVGTWMRHPSYGARVDFRPHFTDQLPNTDIMRRRFRQGDVPPCDIHCTHCCDDMDVAGDDTYEVTSNWSHVTAAVTACVSHLSPAGLALSHLGDGTLDLGLCTRVSRYQNLKFLLHLLLGTGKHLQSDAMHVFRVTEVTIRPRTIDETPDSLELEIRKATEAPDCTGGSPPRTGPWNIDGELLQQPPDAPITFKVHRQLVRVFCQGRENEQKSKKKCCKRLCCLSRNE